MKIVIAKDPDEFEDWDDDDDPDLIDWGDDEPGDEPDDLEPTFIGESESVKVEPVSTIQDDDGSWLSLSEPITENIKPTKTVEEQAIITEEARKSQKAKSFKMKDDGRREVKPIGEVGAYSTPYQITSDIPTQDKENNLNIFDFIGKLKDKKYYTNLANELNYLDKLKFSFENNRMSLVQLLNQSFQEESNKTKKLRTDRNNAGNKYLVQIKKIKENARKLEHSDYIIKNIDQLFDPITEFIEKTLNKKSSVNTHVSNQNLEEAINRISYASVRSELNSFLITAKRLYAYNKDIESFKINEGDLSKSKKSLDTHTAFQLASNYIVRLDENENLKLDSLEGAEPESIKKIEPILDYIQKSFKSYTDMIKKLYPSLIEMGIPKVESKLSEFKLQADSLVKKLENPNVSLSWTEMLGSINNIIDLKRNLLSGLKRYVPEDAIPIVLERLHEIIINELSKIKDVGPAIINIITKKELSEHEIKNLADKLLKLNRTKKVSLEPGTSRLISKEVDEERLAGIMGIPIEEFRKQQVKDLKEQKVFESQEKSETSKELLSLNLDINSDLSIEEAEEIFDSSTGYLKDNEDLIDFDLQDIINKMLDIGERRVEGTESIKYFQEIFTSVVKEILSSLDGKVDNDSIEYLKELFGDYYSSIIIISPADDVELNEFIPTGKLSADKELNEEDKEYSDEITRRKNREYAERWRRGIIKVLKKDNEGRTIKEDEVVKELAWERLERNSKKQQDYRARVIASNEIFEKYYNSISGYFAEEKRFRNEARLSEGKTKESNNFRVKKAIDNREKLINKFFKESEERVGDRAKDVMREYIENAKITVFAPENKRRKIWEKHKGLEKELDRAKDVLFNLQNAADMLFPIDDKLIPYYENLVQGLVERIRYKTILGPETSVQHEEEKSVEPIKSPKPIQRKIPVKKEPETIDIPNEELQSLPISDYNKLDKKQIAYLRKDLKFVLKDFKSISNGDDYSEDINELEVKLKALQGASDNKSGVKRRKKSQLTRSIKRARRLALLKLLAA